MPRPHGLPRKSARKDASPFPALDLRLPVVRVLASVNLHRLDKSVVDAFQSFLSWREGRAVSQAETLHAVLELAFSNSEHPLLRGFELPAHLRADAPVAR